MSQVYEKVKRIVTEANLPIHTVDEEKGFLTTSIQGKNCNFTTLIRSQDATDSHYASVLVDIIFPSKVPGDRQEKVLDFLSILNFESVTTRFVLDRADGEIRCRSNNLIDSNEVWDATAVIPLLVTSSNRADSVYPLIMEMIFSDLSAQDAYHKFTQPAPDANPAPPLVAVEGGEVTERERKILNSILNTTVILMSSMMNGLTEAMAGAMGAMASGMAGAVGGEEAESEVAAEVQQKMPELGEEIQAMISELRKDVSAQFSQKMEEIRPLLSDPVYDQGPAIIEQYDFKLPGLTEELDEDALAQYIQLLVSEDPRFTEMFQELVGWMNTLPETEEPGP
jgi:hypothetical protein